MTLTSAAVGLLFGLPRRHGRVASVERDLEVLGEGDTVLLTDHYAPAEDRSGLPVVLIRSPYGRASADLVGRVFAERGHHVVVQSCRGTFGSGGVLGPFHHEVADGRAALDWVRGRSWAEGRGVALFGASYFGFTALAVAARADDADRVVASARGVTAADFRRAVMWPQHAFGLGTALTWIVSLRLQEEPAPIRKRGMRALPSTVHLAAAGRPDEADVLAGTPSPAYRSWLAHGPDDVWWDAIDLTPALDRMPPEVQVAGWYDPFLDEQVDDHARLIAAGRQQRLVIGPWTHGSRGLQGTLLREALARFSGRPAAGIRVWQGGARRWRDLSSWPPPSDTAVMHLGADRTLVEGPAPSTPVEAAFTQDHSAPAPAAGGRSLLPADAGMRRQRVRERRDDLVVFTGAPHGRPLDIAGRPAAVLQVPPGEATGDWVVRLCDVDRFGVSRNVCEGLLRVTAGSDEAASGRLRVELAPTAYRFRRGHRIRMQVSAALHPNWAAQLAPAGPRRRRVLSSPARPSSLILPVVTGWSR